MVDVALLTGFRDLVHLTLHFYELTGFGKSGSHCPDCVCGSCVPVIQEKVPEAITSALAFAQSHCLSSTSSTTTSTLTSGWSFNLFWWGCLVGFVVSTFVWVLLLGTLRCLRSATTGRAAGPNPPRALALQNQSESEPANPTTLRELGLIR